MSNLIVHSAYMRDATLTVNTSSTIPHSVALEYHFEPTFSEQPPEKIGEVAAFHIFDDIEWDSRRFARARFTLQ